MGIRTSAGNLGAGRTAAEVAPIGWNQTTAGIRNFSNGIPQIPQKVVGEVASCCAQSLVLACRIRHCGVQQVKLVFFFRIKTKGKVKSHFETNLKVTVRAKRRSTTVPKVYFSERTASNSDGRP